MEIKDISTIVSFELVSGKSDKGNMYNAFYIVIKDKEGNYITRQLVKFLTDSQCNKLLTLLK